MKKNLRGPHIHITKYINARNRKCQGEEIQASYQLKKQYIAVQFGSKDKISDRQ